MHAFTYVARERAVRWISQFLFLIVVSITCAAPQRRRVTIITILCTLPVQFRISHIYIYYSYMLHVHSPIPARAEPSLMTLTTLPHPRLLPLILAVLFIIFALSSLLFRDYAPILNPIPNTFVRRERTQNPYSLFGCKGNTISIQTVLDAGARIIAESSEHFDTIGAKRDLGIDIGGNWTLQSYADYLENTWHEFLVPQGSNADHPTLQTVISYTSLLPREQEIETVIPKLIYTTDLLEPQQLPEQFQSWITQNPDWTAMFVEDGQIDTWLEKSLGSKGIKSKAQDELLALKEKWGVVRADLFRWVAL